MLQSKTSTYTYLSSNVDSNSNESSSSDSIITTSSIISEQHHVTVEYCTGCRWLLRSSWLMQELLTTFEQELSSVTLIPSKPPSPGGTFRVNVGNTLLWDRKTNGGFPESKQLKQLIRNEIAPRKDLGHSDSKGDNSNDKNSEDSTSTFKNDCIECQEDASINPSPSSPSTTITNINSENDNESNNESNKPPLSSITISYCCKSKWLMRSAWLCQEILSTFYEDLYSITLSPMILDEGQFVIELNDKTIWDEHGQYPDVEILKGIVQKLLLSPETADDTTDDTTVTTVTIVTENDDENDKDDDADDDLFDTDIDEDDMEELRRYYGVI